MGNEARAPANGTRREALSEKDVHSGIDRKLNHGDVHKYRIHS